MREKPYFKVSASNCFGCKHARLSAESYRGIDCVAGLARDCLPDFANKRFFYVEANVQEEKEKGQEKGRGKEAEV